MLSPTLRPSPRVFCPPAAAPAQATPRTPRGLSWDSPAFAPTRDHPALPGGLQAAPGSQPWSRRVVICSQLHCIFFPSCFISLEALRASPDPGATGPSFVYEPVAIGASSQGQIQYAISAGCNCT